VGRQRWLIVVAMDTAVVMVSVGGSVRGMEVGRMHLRTGLLACTWMRLARQRSPVRDAEVQA